MCVLFRIRDESCANRVRFNKAEEMNEDSDPCLPEGTHSDIGWRAGCPWSGGGRVICPPMKAFGGKCRCGNQPTTFRISFGPIATYLRRYYAALPSDVPPRFRWVLPYWSRNRHDRRCRPSYPHHPVFLIYLCSIVFNPMSRLNLLLTKSLLLLGMFFCWIVSLLDCFSVGLFYLSHKKFWWLPAFWHQIA